jgi:LmbE family N-acetylglucosaminyl deacetylase
MRQTKSRAKYNLLVIAHPDDDSIFFAGLLMQRRKHPWKVICITDGNADGQGAKRKRQFMRATSALGVKDREWWGFHDVFAKRLPVDEIKEKLLGLPKPHEVFTHGIIGEYMHPHHQDVSFSVHQAFSGQVPVYSTAYNAFPELRISLSKREFELKSKILTRVYGSETSRFLNLLPSTSSEGFLQVSLKEVNEIYGFLAHRKPLRFSRLSAYKWMIEYLRKRPPGKRPF